MDSAAEQSVELFKYAWDSLGRPPPRFPKQIRFLSGPPGAGKTTFAEYVSSCLGFASAPIHYGQLLDAMPDHEEAARAGALSFDRAGLKALFGELVKPQYAKGVVVDGFPRNDRQAEAIKKLSGVLAIIGESPRIEVIVMEVTEAVSLERQEVRGLTEIAQGGQPKSSDLNPEARQKRYDVYRQKYYAPLRNLLDEFGGVIINTNGTKDEVRRRISEMIRIFTHQPNHDQPGIH